MYVWVRRMLVEWLWVASVSDWNVCSVVALSLERHVAQSRMVPIVVAVSRGSGRGHAAAVSARREREAVAVCTSE